jgi:hypothetical protein
MILFRSVQIFKFFYKKPLDYNVMVWSSNFKDRCECEAWFSFTLGQTNVWWYLNKILLNLKIKFAIWHVYAETEGRRTSCNPFTSALEGDVWPAPPFYRFTLEEDDALIVQEAGCASEPLWRNSKYLAPTGIRFPDRPTRSVSEYWLRYTCLH